MFVISEIFPQHGGSLAVAEQMILQSKLAGADAIKVQLYTATQFGAERAYLELSKDGLKRLSDYAKTIGIPLFATPFTMERLDWCLELDLPYLKVAARMHKEFPELTAAIMSHKKPTFVSIPSDTNPDEIEKVDYATYLYCVVKYPTRVDEFSMPDFKIVFSTEFQIIRWAMLERFSLPLMGQNISKNTSRFESHSNTRRKKRIWAQWT